MIAILKIDSADVINETQSDTLALCLIPSNRIKYKLSELPILKEIINQNVDVEEKTDPPDPDQYIFIDDVPEYFWKFIKYALTNPTGIRPDSYLHLCNLLLAKPIRPDSINLYDFSNNTNLLIPYPLGTYKQITFGENSYQFQTHSRLMSTFRINPRKQFITIKSVFYTDTFAVNKAERITRFLTPTNFNSTATFYQVDKSNPYTVRLMTQSSTVSGYSQAVTLSTNNNGLLPKCDQTHPITLTAMTSHYGDDTTTSAAIYLKADYHTSTGKTYQETVVSNLNERIFPTDLIENMGSFVITSGSSNTTQNAIPNIISHEVWIYDPDTRQKQQVRYIDFNKSKVINEKLMMIA